MSSTAPPAEGEESPPVGVAAASPGASTTKAEDLSTGNDNDNANEPQKEEEYHSANENETNETNKDNQEAAAPPATTTAAEAGVTATNNNQAEAAAPATADAPAQPNSIANTNAPAQTEAEAAVTAAVAAAVAGTATTTDAEATTTATPKPTLLPTNNAVPKHTRLYFAKDDGLFQTMAQLYLQHDLAHHDGDAERWEIAVHDFYESGVMHQAAPRKAFPMVKKSFLSGLDKRYTALEKQQLQDDYAAADVNEEESDVHALVRQIWAAREHAAQEKEAAKENNDVEDEDNEDDGEDNNDTTTTTSTVKKRKRRSSKCRKPRSPSKQTYKKRKAPDDLVLDDTMKARLEAVERDRQKAYAARQALEDAEVALEAARLRVEDAKVEKAAAELSIEDVSNDFAKDVVVTQEGRWKDFYMQLKEYYEKNGTCIVRGHTPEMKALRNWTLKQRERYHLPDDNPNKLPWYLAKNLDAIQFLWKYSDDTWMRHYADLLAYKQEFGDTAVPRHYKPNPSLGHWVKRVRFDGNKFRDNPDSVSMTQEQYDLLEKIGFIWENLSRSWNERLQDLIQFKQQHGHCRVPKNFPENPKLVQWCQNQRAHYRAMMLGKKSTMSMERKKQLDELGFEWEHPGRPSTASSGGGKRRDRGSSASGKKGGESDSEDDDDDGGGDGGGADDAQQQQQQPATAAVVAEAVAAVPPTLPGFPTNMFAFRQNNFAGAGGQPQPPPQAQAVLQQQQQHPHNPNYPTYGTYNPHQQPNYYGA